MKKILIVEDCETSRKAFECLLSPNYQLYFASSLAEARQHLQENQFSAVILDYYLPDGKGDELLALTQQTPAIICTIIDLSAEASDMLKTSFIEAGAFAYLSKEKIDFLNDLVEIAVRHDKQIKSKVQNRICQLQEGIQRTIARLQEEETV